MTERSETPIAAELQAHFDRGGTPADAVRLVEALERASKRALIPAKERTSEPRGTRLPTDWRPSASDIAFARDRGLANTQIAAEAEKFTNYWTAKCGAGATKRDWAATWRNWIINAQEKGYGRSYSQGHRPSTHSPTRRAPTGSDAILAGMGRLARRIDERRGAAGTGRQVSDATNAPVELDLEPRRTR
ncbi:hypothetical protein DW352_05140 [Pseudolabrys taiwanensis]|uniref:Uncharacterized protein n=1 Tax=Pseudolabrys taiwanensis TaxID=331696 RepID=A0A345ZSQ7_9HYPH|nr:hypothetical protein [Pseudolabrys taiwanensis]AXK79954.1 hypothetical protein DW352_05140 [Pseudolabrys taiwanensis]